MDGALSDELVLRPSTATYKGTVIAAPGLVAVYGAAMVARGGRLGLVAAGITVAACGLCIWRYLRTAQVILTPTELGHVGFLGSRRMRSRSEIGTVLRVDELGTSSLDTRAFPALFVLDQAGRRMVRLGGWLWARGDMDRLASELGLAPVVIRERIMAKALGEHYPGAVGWHERHPVIFGCGAAMLAVALVGALWYLLASL